MALPGYAITVMMAKALKSISCETAAELVVTFFEFYSTYKNSVTFEAESTTKVQKFTVMGLVEPIMITPINKKTETRLTKEIKSTYKKLLALDGENAFQMFKEILKVSSINL